MYRKSYYLIHKNLEKYAQQIKNGTSTSLSSSKEQVDQHIIPCYINQASSCKALEDREPLGSSLSGHTSIITADMPSTKRLLPTSEEEQTLEQPKRKKVGLEMEQASSDEEWLETAEVPTSSTEIEMSPSTLEKNGSATSPNVCLQKISHVVNNSKVRKALALVSCYCNPNNNLVDCTSSRNDDTKLKLILEKLDVLTQQHDILKQQQCRGFAIMMKQLENIYNEQKVMNRILVKLYFPVTRDEANIVSKLPSLPVATMDDLTELEEAIECPEQKELLIHRLSLIGGAKFSSTVNNIMKNLLSKSVAIKFSLLGKLQKMAFTDLKSYSCVMEAVRRTSKGQGSSEHDIRHAIGLNLIGARDRGNGRQERQKKYDEKDASGNKHMMQLLQS